MSQAPLGQMIIELGLDSSDFGKGLQSAKREVKYWSSDMKASMRAADLAGNQLGKFEAKHRGLTNVIGAQRKSVDQLKQSYENSFVDGKPTAQTEKLAAQLRNAESQLISYNKQLAVNAGDMAKWKVENEGITGSLNRFGGVLEKRGKQMADFGDKMTTRVTLPIVAGVGLAVKAAMDWESAFAGVRKTNEEVVDANGNVVYSFSDLENELRGLSKQLPATHAEIAGVAQAAGQLGIQTDNVTSFTKTMIDMGESTNMSSEQAATSMARFANITKMSQSDFDKLGSTIVDLGNNLATTESEITEMGLRLAGAGAQIGMTQGEILGFAGALSSVGIEAQAGGSAFSKVMVQMQLATEQGSNAFKDLAAQAELSGVSWGKVVVAVNKGGNELKEVAGKLGMTSSELKELYKKASDAEESLTNFAEVAQMTNEEFANLFQDDPSQAIMKFVEGLSKAEEQGTSAISVLDGMGISEVRLRDSLLRAANASGIFQEAVERGNNAWEENTALTNEANVRYETLESQLGMLRNEANDVAITFGGPFVGALKDGLVTARPLIERLADMAKAFSDMDPEMQQTIVKTLAITAAAGPLLSITGRLASGVGGLTTKSIGLLGVMARKKTIKEFTTQLAMGSTDIMSWGGAATAATTATGQFGGAAATAAGAQGVGAMTTSLGLLGPIGWGIVGAGGVLAVGYGAWKLWGEEAYNAGQRTKRWGTDVGEATDEALTEIQGYSQSAIGEFGLLEKGFDANVGAMVSNFESMGQSIQTELTDQINAFRESIDMLPEEVRGAAQEIVDEAVKTREDTLKIVEENNERVAELRKRATDNNRESTIAEADMIRSLMQESAAEYLKITIEDADARQTVMDALTGNVAEATEEQAKAWIQSLGEQRRASNEDYTNKLADYKEYLDEQGVLNTEEGKKLVELFEQSKDASSDALDAQIALIAEKYPELANEVFFANGQMIDGMDEASKEMIKSNEKIIENATRLTAVMAKSAEENAEVLSWTANEAKRGGQVWNDIVFDPKTGEVKTNVREAVIEAAENTQTWNDIRFQLKNADLDSNAKQIIGEAAIQNGWWDGMSWEEKQIIINDEFSETIIRSLEDSGKWNEMELEEQTALMYSNSPEKMTEALAYLGLWDEYEAEVKQINADNYGFISSIMESEEKMAIWESVTPDTKDILGNNYDLLTKIFSSEESLNRFKELPDEQKAILGNNADLLLAVTQSEQNYNRWLGLPENDKKFLGENADLLNTVLSSETEYNRWLRLPEKDKKILGNNADLLNKVLGSEKSYNDWKKLPEFEKDIMVNNSKAVTPTENAIGVLTDYKQFYPGPTKILNTDTNASNTNRYLKNVKDTWRNISSGTKTFTTIFKSVKEAIGYEKGTNYHPGGPMIVNDQKGSKFRELVQRTDGYSYIPSGRNVLLNEKPGTKVFKASLTEKMFPGIPQYANGVGIPSDSTVIQGVNRVREATSEMQSVVVKNDFGALEGLLSQMLNVISRLKPEVNIGHINLENAGEQDIRRISENLAFISQVNERGRMSNDG